MEDTTIEIECCSIFSVRLPERFIRAAYVAPSAPGSSGCLQRVDPFTVALQTTAPESFTPSVDKMSFPANFISKIAYGQYDIRKCDIFQEKN